LTVSASDAVFVVDRVVAQTRRAQWCAVGGACCGFAHVTASPARNGAGPCLAVTTDSQPVGLFAKSDDSAAASARRVTDDGGANVVEVADQAQDHRERGVGTATVEQFGCRL